MGSFFTSEKADCEVNNLVGNRGAVGELDDCYSVLEKPLSRGRLAL